MSKTGATWHPRPCPPWVCRHCGHSFPVTQMNELHEPKCDQRQEDQ